MKIPDQPSQILFLPGALGRTELWQPVIALLNHPARKMHVGWPGFGGIPPDPRIEGIDDLVGRLLSRIDRPTALVAQSMGGAIALRAALKAPGAITHLVLTATSGGIDVGALGGEDWRPAFHAANPHLPRWFADDHEDLSARLPEIDIPALLLWGDADPVSPPRVGEYLASHLPRAQMHVIEGAGHDLAATHAPAVAPLIESFLG